MVNINNIFYTLRVYFWKKLEEGDPPNPNDYDSGS
jgi:hypothetical protein